MVESSLKSGAIQTLSIGATFLLAFSAGQARAEYLEVCAADVQQYCSNVVPGNGRLAACLYAHSQVISDGCFDGTFEASSQLELFFDLIVTVTATCAPDLETHCADSAAGGGERYQCLKENIAKLSPTCSAQFRNSFQDSENQ